VSECDEVKIKTLYTYCEQVGRRGKDCDFIVVVRVLLALALIYGTNRYTVAKIFKRQACKTLHTARKYYFITNSHQKMFQLNLMQLHEFYRSCHINLLDMKPAV
jgi:hypothetical protein